MKTKLLKQVRKRYQINKLTRFDNLYDIKLAKSHNTKVLYELTDNGNYLRGDTFVTLEDAYEKLQEWIIKDYIHKVKQKDSSKVWWLNK